MPYLDGTETLEPKQPPKFCPLCGGAVVTKWRGDHTCGRRAGPRAVPVFVCTACKVGVRVFKFPKKPLFSTRKAARADAAAKYRRL